MVSEALRYYSHQQITPEDEAAVLEVLRSPWLTQGPAVERFEAALAEYVGAKHAVVVSSGTAALHLAYLSLGLQKRYPVVTSPLTFVATANAPIAAGYQVLFTDVDYNTGNIITPYPSSIPLSIALPVHYAGRAAVIPSPENGHPIVIEDACHALGATDFDGCSKVGSCAHSLATVFSFHPVKPITTGEGGAVTTNDQGFADELRALRSHGRDKDGLMRKLGWNYRMNEMSAALGLSQLRRVDEMRGRRNALAERYCKLLHDYDERFEISCYDGKSNAHDGRHAWHLYPVRIKNGRRDEVKAKLNAAGIGAQVHYSPIIPLQPYYRERFQYQEGMFPNAEAWAAEELSLPLHVGMDDDDVVAVVDALKDALR